jgi:hypothetical protein
MTATLTISNERKSFRAAKLVQALIEDQKYNFDFDYALDGTLYIFGNDMILFKDELNDIIDELILSFLEESIEVSSIEFKSDDIQYPTK